MSKSNTNSPPIFLPDNRAFKGLLYPLPPSLPPSPSTRPHDYSQALFVGPQSPMRDPCLPGASNMAGGDKPTNRFPPWKEELQDNLSNHDFPREGSRGEGHSHHWNRNALEKPSQEAIPTTVLGSGWVSNRMGHPALLPPPQISQLTLISEHQPLHCLFALVSHPLLDLTNRLL